MLELVGVTKQFGGVRALDDVSFSVDDGEILGLIGPNGSGKTTAFNVVTGTFRPTSGRVLLGGKAITGRPPHQIARLGIGRTFQLVRPFHELTALDNVLAGALFGRNGGNRRRAETGFALDVLTQVGLEGKAGELASSLTVLERKRLEVARVLAGRPQLVLLDEFMAGMAQGDVPGAVSLVRTINDAGITVVIVEHIVKAITQTCNRVVVLDAGRKLADGSVDDVVKNPAVIAAYLGTRHVGD